MECLDSLLSLANESICSLPKMQMSAAREESPRRRRTSSSERRIECSTVDFNFVAT